MQKEELAPQEPQWRYHLPTPVLWAGGRLKLELWSGLDFTGR
jgi:hypothetical protein